MELRARPVWSAARDDGLARRPRAARGPAGGRRAVRRPQAVRSAFTRPGCGPPGTPQPRPERAAVTLRTKRPMELAFRSPARAAGAREPAIRCPLAGGREPWFD